MDEKDRYKMKVLQEIHYLYGNLVCLLVSRATKSGHLFENCI